MSEQTPRDRSPGDAREEQREFDELAKAGKKGLIGRFNARFNDALQNSRGTGPERHPVRETQAKPAAGADDLALRRARNVNTARMVIPEGVIIEGHLTGGTDTEISGRIEGNVTVEGRLYLGASALVSGNVRAGSLSVDGMIEGKVECSEGMELGPSGRLNGDVVAGRQVSLAGQVFGNVTTPGALRLAATAKLEGDVRARSFTMDEGAALNGTCSMRAPAQRTVENDK